MPREIEDQIILAEERLRLAMLASDVEALDELIAPDLIFTNHFGQVFGKQEDLAAHRSGLIQFHSLEPSEQHIKIRDAIAVVSVRMNVSGIYQGAPFAEDLRYTRIWLLSGSHTCQILAGYICKAEG